MPTVKFFLDGKEFEEERMELPKHDKLKAKVEKYQKSYKGPTDNVEEEVEEALVIDSISCHRCLKVVPVHPRYGYMTCTDGCDCGFALCFRCSSCGRCGRALQVYREVSNMYTKNESERDWIVCKRC